MSQTPIYTIGYGTRQIDAFIAILQAHGIAYLLDVRSKPYSRYKPEFSKEALAKRLESSGIRYVFMGDTLGGQPDDPSCYSDGKVDYAKIEKQGFYQTGIGRLQEAFKQQRRVALMCAEEKPENCHRTNLIGRTLSGLGIPVAHIDEQGNPRTQAEVLERLNTAQLGLFAGGGGGGTAVPPPSPPPLPEFDDYFPDDYAYEEMPLDDGWYPDLPTEPMAEVEPLPIVPAHNGPMTAAAANKLLQQYFGYDSFRPLQADIIQNILNKQDALAIMPTGSGKSLCYQLPALMFPGLTVVATPLISLMEDQVMQMQAAGVPAVYLNSTLSYPEQQAITAQIRAGQVKLLYAAPETLLRPETLLLLKQVPVDCFTIDEAHCISEWGHDFRPEYRQLMDVRRRLPTAVCLALTATATEQVQQDILTSLEMPQAAAFVASFNRENLYLAVEAKTNLILQTLAFLEEHRDDSGIIYCATRRQVDTLTAQLQSRGWSALPYHAGLDDAVRRRHQQQFIRDDVPIMVATIAFGMGINKSNVRFILHADLPKNLESYYQQIGRAGRDGLRADCLLLYSYGDVQTINYFIMQQDDGQQVGARMRLEAMLGFVETAVCRRRPLLTYFGESYTAPSCDFCDNCTAPQEEQADLTIPAQKFLSCVKRTGEFFGMNHIIDVLRGSQSKRVLERGHDRLSTYNIGGEFSKQEWQALARQFIQQGLLTQDMTHGSLKLTPQAYQVFKGEAVYGALPAPPKHVGVGTAVPPHDPALFTLLRTKRKELADADNVPPYVIFSDRSLAEMATYYPQSQNAFAQMHGVGAVKLAQYADQFLPIIREYCAKGGIDEVRKTSVSTPTPSSAGGRTQEVLDLFNAGRTLPELMELYAVKQSTILNHLWKAVQSGGTIRQTDLTAYSQLSPAAQQRVLAAFAELGTERLRPVFDHLHEEVSYDELHLLRLHAVINASVNS